MSPTRAQLAPITTFMHPPVYRSCYTDNERRGHSCEVGPNYDHIGARLRAAQPLRSDELLFFQVTRNNPGRPMWPAWTHEPDVREVVAHPRQRSTTDLT